MKTYIAVNQISPKPNDPNMNFEIICQTVKKNVEEGAKLCIFPEDFLYGVIRGHDDIIDAGKKYNEWLYKFKDLAKKYHVDIIPGSFPRYSNNNTYNSTVYIDKSGKILTSYSKNNLWLSERREYTPFLKAPTVFDSILGETAIIICWDIFDHTLFRTAVKNGAKWIIILSFWSVNQSKDLSLERGSPSKSYGRSSDPQFLDHLILSRATEYNVGIIFCNYAGTHQYKGQLGIQTAISANRSQVVDSHERVYGRLSNRKAATLICEIDNDDIAQGIKDFEITYGRREDVAKSYPYTPA